MKDIINKALKAKQITQKELAEKLYVTPQAVSKRINGESQPSFDNIQAMGEIFGESFKLEILREGSVKKKNMEINKNIYELDTVEKIKEEAEEILKRHNIEKFRYPVYVMLKWILITVIASVYYLGVNETEEMTFSDPYEYEDIYTYLAKYTYEDEVEDDQYRNCLEEVIDMIMTEVWGEDSEKKKGSSLFRWCYYYWTTYLEAVRNLTDKSLLSELKIAVLETIS